MAAASRLLRRHAHFHTSPVIVPSSSSSSASSLEPYAALSLGVDPNYYKRYRDPTAHDESSSIERQKLARATLQPLLDPPGPGKGRMKATRRGKLTKIEDAGREAVEASWIGPEVAKGNPTQTQKAEAVTATERPMAALFSGTGSQYLLMGSFLLSSEQYTSARQTWEEAEEALSRFETWRKDLDLPSHPELQKLDLENWPAWQNERPADSLRKVVFGGSQSLLTKSSNAQPAILITAIALLRTLEKEFDTPICEMAGAFAGHSSGEFAALVASGAITFAEGVWLTRLHGLLTSRTLMTSSLQSYMAEDAPAQERAQMSAIVINPNITHNQFASEVQQIRRAHRGTPLGVIEIASFNSSAQIVLAGTRAAIHHTAHLLHEKGMAYHAADIPCWTAFHTRSQIPAEAGMKVALSHPSINLKAPSKPVVSCLSGEILSTPEEIKTALVSQISRPVRWTTALETLKGKLGVRDFVYVGGKALANLAKREVERGNWGEEKDWGIHCASTEGDLKNIAKRFGKSA